MGSTEGSAVHCQSYVLKGNPRYCTQHLILHTPEPTVIELRPGVYHYEGLLPWCEQQCFVIVPSVYSPTKFCCRKLTGVELMNVLDVPMNVQGQLNGSDVKTIIDDTASIPLKCASIVLEGLLEVLEVNVRDLNSKYNEDSFIVSHHTKDSICQEVVP
jgi:hypothetical protein